MNRLALRFGLLITVLLLFTTARAQSVSVYSELTRIDPFGQPVHADRGTQPPREIISPAISRNAPASFHLVVEGEPNQTFTLQLVQNPDDALRMTAYRERYTKIGDAWVPDVLEPIPLTYDGRLGDASIPGQTAQSFWVDLLASRSAPVRRVRVEAQVFINHDWIVYPLEVRVRSAMAGTSPPARTSGASSISQPAVASAIAAWAQLICGGPAAKELAGPLTLRDLIARNAGQDVRFAGGVPPVLLLRLSGATDRASFCRGPRRAAAGEEYLAVRDSLIGARE